MTAESIVNFDLTLSLASLWYQLVRPIISSGKLKSVTEKDPHHTPSLSLSLKKWTTHPDTRLHNSFTSSMIY
jgi:hypothetical protein